MTFPTAELPMFSATHPRALLATVLDTAAAIYEGSTVRDSMIMRIVYDEFW